MKNIQLMDYIIILVLAIMIAIFAILTSGCATYEVIDGNGKIVESGKTFGFLRTMEVETQYEDGKIKSRKISTKSSTKDIMMGANELIDTTVDSAIKMKP